MSFDSQSNANNAGLNATRPTHHIHDSSEPLPGSGARNATSAQDYTPANIERTPSSAIHESSTPSDALSQRSTGGYDSPDSTRATMGSPAVGTGAGGASHISYNQQKSSQGKSALDSDRQPDVQPSSAGGVAVGGQDDSTQGHATMSDKIVGKTQKVMGKYMNKPAMHDKGEVRETSGKDAAQTMGRTAHD
ncbi:hypothetical protein SERLA73DRAFT_187902 [Serpula lacrymans var. lacrymans S7.3]|uniref:Uncharacterized protein n=2 Tax=Serpula lacrymans var. lacrymans TaxID=341189 RepID=F8QAP4_SERL3|nr:uncharacterized protein SERLADRAFT_477801 [Serpula lacrymans var. lacrymans S7.9]EGN94834.1 hypothetical protein SERLA73DRAFT_187902 [Serpula lacrymans var. lacrymans S7.3]EGO20335.1 hypothetical protein SERLADRAFT_477801 [Serpula lacrymans var. lacrymans S7.9]